MTNADKIRQMSDDELADFISNITSECESNTECNQQCYGCDNELCDYVKCIEWLRKEVI